MTGRRPDELLHGLDIEAAIVAGMPESGEREGMFTDAVIAASHEAERLEVGPYPLGFLAGCVRSLGLRGALELPEPLIGAESTALVRRWMSAADRASEAHVERDELFARWLERVAIMIAVRAQVRLRATSGSVAAGEGSAPVERETSATDRLLAERNRGRVDGDGISTNDGAVFERGAFDIAHRVALDYSTACAPAVGATEI